MDLNLNESLVSFVIANKGPFTKNHLLCHGYMSESNNHFLFESCSVFHCVAPITDSAGAKPECR